MHTTTKQAQNFEDFADLDAILAESLQEQETAQKMKAKKAAVNRGAFAGKEAAEAKEAVRAWESTYYWIPKARVAIFQPYACSCGNTFKVFSGLHIRQAHKTMVNGRERWVADDGSAAALPKEVKILETIHQGMCEYCAEDDGYVESV